MITLLILPTSKILAHFRLWLCSAHLSIKALTFLECQKCNNQAGQGSQIIFVQEIPQPGSRQHTVVETHFLLYIYASQKCCLQFSFHFLPFNNVLKRYPMAFQKLNSYRLCYIENEYLPIHVVNWYTLLYCFYVKTLPSEEVICFWKFSKLLAHTQFLKNVFWWIS